MPIAAESSARFDKRVRLLKPAQFDAVFKQGRRFSSGRLSAVIAVNTFGFARLGFAIAKKQAPLAVQRNRIKRILRDRFRRQNKTLDAVDLVVTLRSKLPVAPRELTKVVESFWNDLARRCSVS